MSDDPTLDAVKSGEDRAEREWLLEQGRTLPDRLKPYTCRQGTHVYSLQHRGCVYCGEDYS